MIFSGLMDRGVTFSGFIRIQFVALENLKGSTGS